MQVNYDEDNTSKLMDSATIDLMIVIAARLDHTLKEFGAQEALRRKIVENHIFWLGYMFDMEWIRHEGRRLYPVLCLAEKDDYSEPIKVLHVPTSTCHHDYAIGNVAAVYENQEAVNAIHIDDSSEDI